MPRFRTPLKFITNDSIFCEIGVWKGNFKSSTG